MLKQFSYKKKKRLLWALIAISVLLIWRLSLSRTIETIVRCNELNAQFAEGANSPEKLSAMEKELAGIESSMTGTESRDPQALLEMISEYCKTNHCVLREFPEAISSEEEKLVVETSRVIVQGSFRDLLGLSFAIEQRRSLGKVVSVDYSLKLDRETRKEFLQATLFIQNIKMRS